MCFTYGNAGLVRGLKKGNPSPPSSCPVPAAYCAAGLPPMVAGCCCPSSCTRHTDIVQKHFCSPFHSVILPRRLISTVTIAPGLMLLKRPIFPCDTSTSICCGYWLSYSVSSQTFRLVNVPRSICGWTLSSFDLNCIVCVCGLPLCWC